MIRVGIGFDIHRLVSGREMVIGGVRIPFEMGLLGHSDADVLTHATIDALLGACALGDIGRYFPSSDERWRNISSLTLLRKTMSLIESKGYKVKNMDATVIAEAPPLARWIPEMRVGMAAVLNINDTGISIKATTSKGVGPVGAGEAIAAQVVVLVERIKE
jgi:2-C-methyl-D-erythritol 2,4-cyclodiphosphate synthase